jgi:hypothetical protein
MQVARHPLHRTPFAFSNEFMTGQTIANPINDLQRVGGFSRYQSALVALSAFVQFTIILDFTIMSPLGAIIMPTLGVDTLSVRPFEYVPSLDTTLVEARCVAWRVPRNFLEVATFNNRSEIPGDRSGRRFCASSRHPFDFEGSKSGNAALLQSPPG